MQSGAIAQSCETATIPYQAPRDFMEFRDRHLQPGYNYISIYLRTRGVPLRDMDDYISELTTLLLTPVGGSGLVDRIAYYNRDKQAGVASTQGHFLKWLKGIMGNKVTNLLKRDPAARGVIQCNTFDVAYAPEEGAAASEWQGTRAEVGAVGHVSNRNAREAFEDFDTERDTRMDLDSFRSYLKRHNPSLVNPLDLFMDFEEPTQVACNCGVPLSKARRWKTLLIREMQWFRCGRRRSH